MQILSPGFFGGGRYFRYWRRFDELHPNYQAAGGLQKPRALAYLFDTFDSLHLISCRILSSCFMETWRLGIRQASPDVLVVLGKSEC